MESVCVSERGMHVVCMRSVCRSVRAQEKCTGEKQSVQENAECVQPQAASE